MVSAANSHVHDDEGELLKSIEIEARRIAELRKAERHARAQLATSKYALASARAPRLSSKQRWTFAMFAAVLLPIMLLSSIQFGTTWDEPDRHLNGEHVWQFLTGQADRASFSEEGGAAYGGLFDLICVILLKWVPLERALLRHAVNAVFGWIGIVYCGRLASRLFGPWSGLLAMILLSTSPPYFADSMNNPKDLPFAAAAIVALYYLSTIHPRWPYLAP